MRPSTFWTALCFAALACTPAPSQPPTPPQAPAPPQTQAPQTQAPPQAQAPQQAPPQTPPRAAHAGTLEVGGWLRPEDVRAVFGELGPLVEDQVPGIAPREDYGSARLRPAQAAGRHGFALQVWEEAPAQAEARMTRHEQNFQAPRPTEALGVRAFLSKQGEVLHLGWLEGGRVVTLSCEEALCREPGLVLLAQRVRQRMGR